MTENTAIASVPAQAASGINATYEDLRHKLAEKMAGEITLSDNPGETLKTERTVFEISNQTLRHS